MCAGVFFVIWGLTEEPSVALRKLSGTGLAIVNHGKISEVGKPKERQENTEKTSTPQNKQNQDCLFNYLTFDLFHNSASQQQGAVAKWSNKLRIWPAEIKRCFWSRRSQAKQLRAKRKWINFTSWILVEDDVIDTISLVIVVDSDHDAADQSPLDFRLEVSPEIPSDNLDAVESSVPPAQVDESHEWVKIRAWNSIMWAQPSTLVSGLTPVRENKKNSRKAAEICSLWLN